MSKPKLRMAPALSAIADQQRQSMQTLQRLQSWTEVPLNPPADGEKDTPAPIAPPAPPKEPPAPAKWPWELVSPDALHQYSFFLPKPLFVKADYCWKRSGAKSMKDFVAQAIDAYCTEKLKELGDKP